MLFALVFALTAWIWPFYVNVIIALPALMLSLVCWYFGRMEETAKSRFSYVLYLIALGVLVSIIAIFFFIFSR
ncbi:MAG: hypothetical protein H6579_01210 [Chitinophagales bacterium]|nr:hypothetical protein [Chitinophagales bacterium]